jgi:hypothetical protein
MHEAELELLHAIVTRLDTQGNVLAEDVKDFERICFAASERRSRGEPTVQGSARS